MDSQFMDAGTYAWIVLIIFFVIFASLQIRNCIRNVRGDSSAFSDMYPNEPGTSCGGQTQSSVYTIDVNNGMQSNFSNPAYVSTEGSAKNPSHDGLPSYEEAIGVVKSPIVPTSQSRSTIEVVNEDVSTNGNGGSEGGGGGGGGRRHRRRRHHHRNHNSHNENSESNATDNEPRRHRHRRGFRQHLAKVKSRNYRETE